MSVNVQIEQLPACQTKITLSFDATDVDAAFDRVYKEIAAHGRIPGFRPGKAPRSLIRRHISPEALRDTAFGELIRDPLEEALEDLNVVDTPQVPDVKDLAFDEGQPLELELIATSGPRVKVADLSGITLFQPQPEATDEDIDKILADLRETHAEERATDRQEVQLGDSVDLSMKVTVEGAEAPVDDVEQTIVVGQGEHFPKIDDELVGKSVGSVVEMDVTYPEDYHDESLAGKSAKIAATIKALRERVLPELDDELAKKVDAERFETLDALRTEIKRQADEQRADYAREEVESQVIKALLEQSEIEVPEVLVERMYQSNVASLSDEFKAGGMSLDEFRDMAGISEDDFGSSQRRRASRMVMTHAVMGELAQGQAEPTSEEIEAEADVYARENNMDAAFVRQALPLQETLQERLADRVLRRRIYDAIISNADLQTIPLEEYRSKRDELLKYEDPEEAAAEESPAAEAETAEAVEAPETAEDAATSQDS
jgi:trigger factor